MIASPDGEFFLYEWMRPYNWVRDTKWLPPKTAERMQAWLYRVDVTYSDATSEYLFFPDPGSGYWLGDLSPDGTRVTFYELDNDEDKVKAGVWHLMDEKLTWFETPPDAKRLDEPALWLSNEEVAYPAKSGSADLVKANVSTGKTSPCPECKEAWAARKKASSAPADLKPRDGFSEESAKILEGARLVARSPKGGLEVYLRDTPEVLAMMYRKGEREVEVIFENSRK